MTDYEMKDYISISACCLKSGIVVIMPRDRKRRSNQTKKPSMSASISKNTESKIQQLNTLNTQSKPKKCNEP